MEDTMQQLFALALPVLFAITMHEYAHAYLANRHGDPTARLMGRMTANPVAHIDIFGTIVIPLVLFLTSKSLFGYAKPVPINFLNLRNPKRDMAVIAAGGPATNILLAIVSGLVFRLLTTQIPEGGIGEGFLGWVLMMAIYSVQINVVLAFFNLIPIPPLDGGRILTGLLPDHRARFLHTVEPFGILIVLGLLFVNPLGIMNPLWLCMEAVTKLFLGL